jgi:hypothetical protein
MMSFADVNISASDSRVRFARYLRMRGARLGEGKEEVGRVGDRKR